MGLFDFASDIGKKIFGNDDDDASEKLQEHIEQDNPGVSGLKVEVQGDTAVITGEAESKSAMENSHKHTRAHCNKVTLSSESRITARRFQKCHCSFMRFVCVLL